METIIIQKDGTIYAMQRRRNTRPLARKPKRSRAKSRRWIGRLFRTEARRIGPPAPLSTSWLE